MNIYYIGNPKDGETQELESVIVGTIKDQRILKDGRIVVKTPFGVKETPDILKNWEKVETKDIASKLKSIENE